MVKKAIDETKQNTMYSKFQTQIEKFLEKTRQTVIAQKTDDYEDQCIVWTERFIIFLCDNDGYEFLAFLSRNPIDISPYSGPIHLEAYLDGECDLNGNYL